VSARVRDESAQKRHARAQRAQRVMRVKILCAQKRARPSSARCRKAQFDAVIIDARRRRRYQYATPSPARCRCYAIDATCRQNYVIAA